MTLYDNVESVYDSTLRNSLLPLGSKEFKRLDLGN